MKSAWAKECWHVYLLRCRDDSLYCGISNDLAARVARHNSGRGAKYTRSRRPVRVVYARRLKDRSTALKHEYRIKQMSKAEKEKLCARRIYSRVPASKKKPDCDA